MELFLLANAYTSKDKKSAYEVAWLYRVKIVKVIHRVYTVNILLNSLDDFRVARYL